MIKSLSAAAAASLLLFPLASRADDLALKDTRDKVSYSIGVNLGRSMHKDSVDVNPDAVAAGLKDGLAGGPTKMTDEEMSATMTAFSTEMQQKMQAKQQALGSDNKTKGAAFLAENQKKEGWKTTASGLQYKVLTTGTGDKPKATDTVVTNYRGTTIDGTEFDSSYKRNEPAEFPVNAVIPGWTEALQMMPVGSKWQLAVPAELAYGENAPPQIGPNSVLLFDVELLGIKKPGADASPSPAAK
jgi:FKBP-type peptidyl-prolyl cis-trans isomerase FklB